ncbi:SHOCT domain-containing protein [Actinoplanes derwentensis]|uniref:Putative membrane protein n=1 Tax=Actinoplanes derwentensis TaxID=113562 RepID=A0A1H2B7P3_9ACTN|nr:SHOCT domain-containing protein [Actinoplanes derwentensis]GID86419.1 hypothetical protein Ade03nite_53430 [Actinoplanes derwentensis]SDT53939.1 putative membrane protein [Actinoplanes derwentensis]
MMYYGNGMNGWGMFFMIVNSLLFWGLIVAGVVAMARYAGRDLHHRRPVAHGTGPQQMLAERFARGDIDDDEYARRLQVLDTTAPAHGPGD